MHKPTGIEKVLTLVLLLILGLDCGNEPEANENAKNFLENPSILSLGPENFLQGKYSPQSILTEFRNPGDDRIHYLLPEVYQSYLAMKKAFEADRPPGTKQTLFIVSSFRGFDHQKSIWESKFTGKTKMRVPIKGKTDSEITQLILEYSSAPGTSRHHWGTDFDLNSLDNSYFENDGKGEFLYKWLRKNASKYGFCQPYNDLSFRDSMGYQEEKWHWSYVPIAKSLQNTWLDLHKKGKIKMDGYSGSKILQDLAPIYVRSVSAECI
jgi:hypothetical protein